MTRKPPQPSEWVARLRSSVLAQGAPPSPDDLTRWLPDIHPESAGLPSPVLVAAGYKALTIALIVAFPLAPLPGSAAYLLATWGVTAYVWIRCWLHLGGALSSVAGSPITAELRMTPFPVAQWEEPLIARIVFDTRRHVFGPLFYSTHAPLMAIYLPGMQLLVGNAFGWGSPFVSAGMALLFSFLAALVVWCFVGFPATIHWRRAELTLIRRAGLLGGEPRPIPTSEVLFLMVRQTLLSVAAWAGVLAVVACLLLVLGWADAPGDPVFTFTISILALLTPVLVESAWMVAWRCQNGSLWDPRR